MHQRSNEEAVEKRGHLMGIGIRWAAVGVLLALVVAGLHLPDWSPDEPPVFGDRPPTRGDIASVVGIGPVDPASERAVKFATMLTQRYRDQNYAVRVILRPAGDIELRCGANMARRQMALVASQVQGDARAIFGRTFDMDLYETYAAGPKRKIAIMRMGPRGSPVLRFIVPENPPTEP